MANIAVYAEGTPTITVSGGAANAGETFDVTVSVSDNPGIISMLLNVSYDKSAMELVNVKDEGKLGAPTHSDAYTANPYILYWHDDLATENHTENGVYATLTFKVSDTAKTGNYEIKASYDKKLDGIFDYNLENVDFATVSGTIAVTGAAGGNGGEAVSGGDEETTPAEPTEITVVINGKPLEFPDQKPVIESDRTLVPLRAIFEALGAEVDWDDETKTVSSKRGETTVSLAIGSVELYVNGEAKIIDVPAQIINDRTMVPIRAIAESYGCEVGWDGRTRAVIITD